MKRRIISIWYMAALGAVMMQACSHGRSAASYRGSRTPPTTTAEGVAEVPVTPSGFGIQGQVRAECVLTERRERIEGEWLSDVDCTERRLTAALREAAADGGGQLLVGKTCRAVRRGERRVVIRCGASVARRREAGASHASSSARARDALSYDDPSGGQAWRIRVHFDPLLEPAIVAPRRSDTVDEVAVLPVAAQLLGVLSVQCEQAPCSVDAVRAGVRVAAGRLGATHVAHVRCVDVNDQPRCLGEAGVLEELPPSSRTIP